MIYFDNILSVGVASILDKADGEKIKIWKLLDMNKMPSFIHGRLVVIGDAAHPFLPHQGQGI
jgi:2-polyprenyl-6-methoxyphenol hydroxylase-like FAD-dependent oxidoreductase